MSRRVAVIDIGSNSIKSLVAEREEETGQLKVLHQGFREVRISQGIGTGQPFLLDERMEAGAAAVLDLWLECRQFGPITSSRIVATSAVRSAGNGATFAARITNATGQPLIILSGDEEADGIARGVMTDRLLAGHSSALNVFDLGGGSLELIHFDAGRVTARCSLPLGSVRLTERYVSDPALPLNAGEQQVLEEHVNSMLASADVPLTPCLVGCGGGINALFALLQGKQGEPVPVAAIESSCRLICQATLDERIALGVPPGRADIFPAALITVLALARRARANQLLHSRRNLRYGIASSLLDA